MALSVAVFAVMMMAFDQPPLTNAHYDHGADVPWFFERTVHIEAGNRVFAGIIWDGETIVTVQHGLNNQTAMVVTDVRGNELDAVLVHADPYSDVAVLTARTDMDPLEMSGAGPGDSIYAVGHPHGRPFAVTGGIISSVDRGAPVTVQHDAAVSTGNSGGPVFDQMGGLVGMNAASDDLAFAVPYEIISYVVESVRERGTYAPGCVGMMLDGNTIRTVRERVALVLQPGDVVISVDGREPFDLLYDRAAGDVVEIVLEDRSVLVQLGYMGKWFGIHKCLDP